eukprot:COSAG04_NODE_1753_length_5696_cov_19.164195_3_plen_195_part_00
MLKEFGGTWSVDERTETSSWWGYRVDRTVSHPKPDDTGSRAAIYCDAFNSFVQNRQAFRSNHASIRKTFGESEGAQETKDCAHFWAKRQLVLDDIQANGDDSVWQQKMSADHAKSIREWISSLQDDRFLAIRGDPDSADLKACMTVRGLAEWHNYFTNHMNVKTLRKMQSITALDLRRKVFRKLRTLFVGYLCF